MNIRVMIVEDDEKCFEVEREAISNEKDMEIVGNANEKQLALKMAKELKPDVILLDINLTDKDDQHGIDVAIELSIELPETKIIMLSGLLNEDTVRSTMGIGVACNYLLKSDYCKMPQAIRDAVEGNNSIDKTVIDFILQDYRNSLKSTMVKLTAHHIKVLELFYRGHSVEQVADILKLETQSVRNLQQQIGKKCLGWKWRFRKLSAFELAQRAKKLEMF
ncbi:response regulator transcription factor (plasmid) [Aneurinibacillus sp. Ricciae_BoGa-3]|uniref:response regulator n=1 Tax=Aneurinibacillus sp. Ricciae_BoGa-3 TaxID=3022697 RepID=UPI00234197E0|nr:response regulator transcription factor [Aneurinibacillus sp. Ricciae_BoGa-3]WCK57309.1 response regulator transcription factor [Aneurinibacillus sp. Ricciae_BoGa-3]